MIDSNYTDTLNELNSSSYDNVSTTNEVYAKQLAVIRQGFVDRNKLLTSLLNSFITQRNARIKTNMFFKKFMFWFFLSLLFILTAAVVTLAFFLVPIVDTLSAAASLISAFLTYLASLIGIFQIISKYLFPSDEEKDTINMIKTVINNDIEVEKITSIESNQINKGCVEQLNLLNELLNKKLVTEEEFVKFKSSLIIK